MNKAAYRAGEKLRDERFDIERDYTRKQHVDEKFILAPPGAPDWVQARETLWNAVERRERRKDAQLAREIEISLPRELTHEQQRELVEAFVSEHFVARGMVADCAIHRPPGKPRTEWTGDIEKDHDHNPHVHVMLTMRELNPKGFGRKRRDWNDWNLKKNTRHAWELAANRALANAGRPERIDMRSYEDRGIDLQAQPKLSREISCAGGDGRAVVRDNADAWQATRRHNLAALMSRPETAFQVLTASGKMSTFTARQMEQLASRYADEGTNEHFELLTALRTSPALVSLGSDARGVEHFSTAELVALERELITSAHLLAQRPGHTVDDAAVNRAVEQAPSILQLDFNLSDEQAAAVRHVTTGGDFAIVEGYAGTGKSTMLAVARVAWEAEGYQVVGAALAGKAADGLKDSSGIDSRTIASWQWNWERGKLHLTHRHVLVVDEAGMVGTQQFAELLAEARRAGAKLVVVGDTKQLQAIDPGAPLRLLQERYGAATLSQVNRQRVHAWQKDATLAFAQERAPEALRSYVAQGRVHGCESSDAAQTAMVERWNADRLAAPTATSLMLAFRRVDVQLLNEKARAIREAAGELGESHVLQTERGARSFAQGDRLYFLRNDVDLGVKNGTLGTIEEICGAEMRVRIDGGQQVLVDTRTYAALDHGYAGTIHKSQGVTVDHAYVFASRYMDAAASYVAMSRHRSDAHMYFSTEEFESADQLVARIGKARKTAMAHEVADRNDAALMERRLQYDAEFLKLTPTEQVSKIEAIRLIGEQEPKAAEAFFRAAPDLRDASARCREATEALSLASGSLAQFEARNPDLTGSEAHHRHLATVQRLTRELRPLEAQLAAMRKDPARWALAREQARQHARRIRAAQKRWRHLRDLKQESERAQVLERFAHAANVKAGARKFRIATDNDRGRIFEQVAIRQLNKQDVLLLRDTQSRALVFAYADHCVARDGRLALRSQPVQQPERATRRRSRGPER